MVHRLDKRLTEPRVSTFVGTPRNDDAITPGLYVGGFDVQEFSNSDSEISEKQDNCEISIPNSNLFKGIILRFGPNEFRENFGLGVVEPLDLRQAVATLLGGGAVRSVAQPSSLDIGLCRHQ